MIHSKGQKNLAVMRSQLITCMGGDFVVYYVSVARVVCVIMIIARNINDRRPRNIYSRWSEEVLESQFHANSSRGPMTPWKWL